MIPYRQRTPVLSPPPLWSSTTPLATTALALPPLSRSRSPGPPVSQSLRLARDLYSDSPLVHPVPREHLPTWRDQSYRQTYAGEEADLRDAEDLVHCARSRAHASRGAASSGRDAGRYILHALEHALAADIHPILPPLPPRFSDEDSLLPKSRRLFSGLCDLSHAHRGTALSIVLSTFFLDKAETIARHESARGLARWCSALCHVHRGDEGIETGLATLLRCRPGLLAELERERGGLGRSAAGLIDRTLGRGGGSGWRDGDAFVGRRDAADWWRDPPLNGEDRGLYVNDGSCSLPYPFSDRYFDRDHYNGSRHRSSSSLYAVADAEDRYLRRLEEDRTYHEVEAERDRRKILQVAGRDP